MFTKVNFNEELLKTLIIYLIVIRFVLDITFKYLIKRNKIKPSKISRLFYYDDESLIKSWEKIKNKGMLKYIIKFIIFSTIYMGIAGIIFKVNNISIFGLEQNQAIIVSLIIGVILGIIAGLMRWYAFNDRYNKLKEKC